MVYAKPVKKQNVDAISKARSINDMQANLEPVNPARHGLAETVRILTFEVYGPLFTPSAGWGSRQPLPFFYAKLRFLRIPRVLVRDC